MKKYYHYRDMVTPMSVGKDYKLSYAGVWRVLHSTKKPVPADNHRNFLWSKNTSTKSDGDEEHMHKFDNDSRDNKK